MIFEYSEEQINQMDEWDREHRKLCTLCQNPFTMGAIGGRLTYTFIPTSLGVITKITCCCGEELDLTDYNW